MTFDKKTAITRIERIMRAAESVSRDWAESVQWHPGYSEPGYDDPESGMIMTANWNEVTRYNRETEERETIDRTPKRVAELLERAGASIEWEDEWDYCADCQKLVRTSPDGHGWKRSYWNHPRNGDSICAECTRQDPTEYLEHLEGNDRSCETMGLDLKALGYRRIEERFESGLHPGQDASPKKIAQALRAMNIGRFVFSLDSTGQFDVSFSVWVHKSERRRFKPTLWKKAPKDGPSNSQALSRALQDASRKMDALPDNAGVKVATCKPDGTADVRIDS